jgi:hypothetical protein
MIYYYISGLKKREAGTGAYDLKKNSLLLTNKLKQQHLPLQNITIVKNDKPISPRPK